MITVYGISNCDTVRKARKWLQAQQVEFQFHDFRKDGLNAEQLKSWAEALGWEALLNKRGTTWRKLPDESKADVDQDKAIALMLEQPAMIKRPLVAIAEGDYLLGFSEDAYQARFG